MSGFRSYFLPLLTLLIVFCLLSCSRARRGGEEYTGSEEGVFFTVTEDAAMINRGQETGGGSEFAFRLSAVMRNAELPVNLAGRIQTAAAENPAFILDLLIILESGRYLRELVDKRHSLSQDYVPPDLVTLTEGSYRVTREGMALRRSAAAALDEMAAAARADGIVLTVASAYRSFSHQTEVYNRNVREMGREAADRVSARPGHSQHQTGLVVDFFPINDTFAETPQGRWITANASHFGWSLSYPYGYEAVTGYRWESWHYRYVGKDLTAFIDNYFDGIQQYALRFLHEWSLYTSG